MKVLERIGSLMIKQSIFMWQNHYLWVMGMNLMSIMVSTGSWVITIFLSDHQCMLHIYQYFIFFGLSDISALLLSNTILLPFYF